MSRKVRVLIIAFPHSIHTARWIQQLDESEFEIVLFPSLTFRPIHEEIQNITITQLDLPDINANRAIKFKYPLPGFRLLQKLTGPVLYRKLLGKFGLLKLQKRNLKKLIREFQPDIIHTMESQQAGYMYADLPRQQSIQWIHSIWGIDLHYFRENQEHLQKLRAMLNKLNLLVVEGERDIKIAKEIGYKGASAIIPSVGGGFDFSIWKTLPYTTAASSRKKILLKGYDGDERLASVALQALRSIPETLMGYEVVIYSLSKKLIPLVETICNQKEFNLTICGELNYLDMLKLVCEARVSITNNLSDGVPNTMLEAMASGSFPIQSNTAITDGWIVDGFNGFTPDPKDPHKIAECIKKSLIDDELVDRAAAHNIQLVREKLDIKTMKTKIKELYTRSN